MHVIKRIFRGLLIVVVIGTVLYFLASSYTYSEGSRTGYLVKFSHKGLLFKTYEGELNLGGMNAGTNSVMNNLWDFSVKSKDEAAIDSLKKYEGHTIKVYYTEPLRKFFWQGETGYFVNKVEVIR